MGKFFHKTQGDADRQGEDGTITRIIADPTLIFTAVIQESKFSYLCAL